MDSKPLASLSLLDEPGKIVKISSSSSTAYYVSTRFPDNFLFLRARGTGTTGVGPTDDQWMPLLDLTSHGFNADGTEDRGDVVKWTLRVGARHEYVYDLNSSEDGWWIQRTCTAIELLDQMPAEGEWANEETEVPPGTPDDYRNHPPM